MTAALAQRTDAPTMPQNEGNARRASSALSRTGAERRLRAVPQGRDEAAEGPPSDPALPTGPTTTTVRSPAAPAGTAMPTVDGPRLAPVPECEPPLDEEPWERPVAGPPFGTQLLWPDLPAPHAAPGSVTPTAFGARAGSSPDAAGAPGGETADGVQAAATHAVPAWTSASGTAPAAARPTPPPMTYRRWSQLRNPPMRVSQPEKTSGRAPSTSVSSEPRGAAPHRAAFAATPPGAPAPRRPQPRGPRPVYSASGGVAQPEEEYADLQPVEIVIHEPELSTTRPPALDAATLLARALVEVLAGRRPPAQLRPHCTDGVYYALGDFPRLGPGPSLVSMWVCEPTQERAEVSACFRCGGMTRALAMRLDGADDRWQITALQLA